MDEKSFGPDHPTLLSASKPRSVWAGYERLVEAEPLYRRALAIHEKSSARRSRRLPNSLNNLAYLLRFTNGCGGRPLYRRALAIAENSLGQRTGSCHRPQ